MQANPSKFQFMIISHSPVDTSKAMLQIDYNIVLKTWIPGEGAWSDSR